MASSGNFSVLNPLDNPTSDSSSNTPSNGNLKFTSSGNCTVVSTIGLTFKSYAEVRIESVSNYGGGLGVCGGTESNVFYKDSIIFQTNYLSGRIYHYKDGTNQAGSVDIGGTVSAGDIIMMCWEPDTFKWWVGVNGTWRNSGDPANGTGFVYQFSSGTGDLWGNGQSNNNTRWGGWTSSANGLTCTWNFGQDSTFGGAVTAGSGVDDNGFGNFKYSPPTGFLAACSGNMVISDDIDPAQTDNDIPTKQMGVVLYTGNGGTNAITGLGFQPDFVWAKSRSATQSNRLYNSSITNGMLFSDNSNSEQTGSDLLTSYGTDGFTYGTSGSNANDNTVTYVAWCWRANGGTTSTNTSGTITSTVQANQAAGFSIITYTGTGSNGSIGHGLSAKPNFHIIKSRSGTDGWAVYHGSIGAEKYLRLDTNATPSDTSNVYNDTEPSSSVISLGTNDLTNKSTSNYVSYVWHNVEGYSKFGSYKGNANDDGPYIYCGFKPELIFIKETGTSDDWVVYDSTRDPINRGSSRVSRWEVDAAEFDGTGRAIDFLASGFKIRTSNNTINQTTNFVFGAWADVPFKYNNTQ